MIFTLLILAIGGFLSPVLCKFILPQKPFCVLEGVLEEEWDQFFNIIDCGGLWGYTTPYGGPNKSCEPTMLETLPTIGKYLG